MNRRTFLATSIAAAGIPGVATAKVWEQESSFLKPTVNPTGTNRTERYARYEKLATEKQFGLLSDPHMMNVGKLLHNALGLTDEDDKKLFGPFQCGRVAMDAAVYGDVFLEVVKPCKFDILVGREYTGGYQVLPPATVFRIETIKGKLVEFQQSKSGPDYAALTKCRVEDEPAQAKMTSSHAIRFAPEHIVHIRPKVHKYAPYGTSALESGEPLLDDVWVKAVFDGLKEVHTRLKG